VLLVCNRLILPNEDGVFSLGDLAKAAASTLLSVGAELAVERTLLRAMPRVAKFIRGRPRNR
jgi:hypothetical protein